MRPINGLAETIVELPKGRVAPFTGNLVPIDMFQEIMVQAREKDLLETELGMCQTSRDGCQAKLDGPGVGSAIAVSFLVGLVVGLVGSHYLKVP